MLITFGFSKDFFANYTDVLLIVGPICIFSLIVYALIKEKKIKWSKTNSVNINIIKYYNITRGFPNYSGQRFYSKYNSALYLNTPIARYTHGPGVDEPLIMERGGSSYYYHTDGLGSIVAITDSTGNIVKSYTYDSFGNIVDEEGVLLNTYTYTSRELDFESGLYYYRARYYDPLIGRFLSVLQDVVQIT